MLLLYVNLEIYAKNNENFLAYIVVFIIFWCVQIMPAKT
jgi:hypothetical protein